MWDAFNHTLWKGIRFRLHFPSWNISFFFQGQGPSSQNSQMTLGKAVSHIQTSCMYLIKECWCSHNLQKITRTTGGIWVTNINEKCDLRAEESALFCLLRNYFVTTSLQHIKLICLLVVSLFIGTTVVTIMSFAVVSLSKTGKQTFYELLRMKQERLRMSTSQFFMVSSPKCNVLLQFLAKGPIGPSQQ